MGIHLETFDVSQMVEEMVSTIRPAVAKNANELSVRVASNTGQMYADLTKVRQILLNLLSNSCKFTKSGTISLEVARTTIDDVEWLQFEVKDTGIGITPEQKENLFREFSQADPSIARKYGGTGRGLAISRHFVQIMRGSIACESELGHGSKFTIRIPAKVVIAGGDPQQPRVELPAHSQSAADRGTILVIDDDPAVLDLMSRSLTKLGFSVAAASSGAEGLRLAKEIHPFLITLDVAMPGIDGWQALKQLKADPGLAQIPVIMVTVVDNGPMGTDRGGSDYLVKPIDRERLALLVERYRSSVAQPA